MYSPFNPCYVHSAVDTPSDNRSWWWVDPNLYGFIIGYFSYTWGSSSVNQRVAAGQSGAERGCCSTALGWLPLVLVICACQNQCQCPWAVRSFGPWRKTIQTRLEGEMWQGAEATLISWSGHSFMWNKNIPILVGGRYESARCFCIQNLPAVAFDTGRTGILLVLRLDGLLLVNEPQKFDFLQPGPGQVLEDLFRMLPPLKSSNFVDLKEELEALSVGQPWGVWNPPAPSMASCHVPNSSVGLFMFISSIIGNPTDGHSHQKSY